MIRSLIRISAVDLGFNPDGLLTMQVLPLERNPDAHKAYHHALLQRLRAVPGVGSVGLVDNFALRTSTRFTSLVVDGKSTVTSVFQVLPGYFETIGASLRQGRLPTDADYASGFSGVVISESAAQALFPEGSPLGRQLIWQPGRPWTVIGVIADLRHRGPLLVTPRPPEVFFPLEPTRSESDDGDDVRHSNGWPDGWARRSPAAGGTGDRTARPCRRDSNRRRPVRRARHHPAPAGGPAQSAWSPWPHDGPGRRLRDDRLCPSRAARLRSACA